MLEEHISSDEFFTGWSLRTARELTFSKKPLKKVTFHSVRNFGAKKANQSVV
jgi:hypothetical protein